LYAKGEYCSDVDDLYNMFLDLFKAKFDYAFPSVRRNKINSKIQKGWVTKGIRISCARKRELTILSRNSGNNELKAYLIKYKKILAKCIKTAKINYNNHNIERSSNKIKTAWDIIKNETSQPRKTVINELLTTKNCKIEDTLDSMNDFFLETCKLLNLSPDSNKAVEYLNNLKPSRNVLVCFKPVNEREIKSIIDHLRPSRTPGWDEIPPFILKVCSKYISRPLAFIINVSLRQGTFPNLLKYSELIPVHKKGDKTDFRNYRPISILCSISKIFEKVVALRLSEHLETNNLLTSNQHGFRKGLSTDTAVYDFIVRVSEALDESRSAVGMFCDLSRAFDCVDNELLLTKLKFYGVAGTTHKWFQSYLSFRKQRVTVGRGVHGHSYKQVKSGVPQGSILGPILFIIFINDLVVNACSTRLTIYADDTTALFEVKNKDSLKTEIQAGMDSISNWFEANGLLLNGDKTQALTFHTAHGNKQLCDVDSIPKTLNKANTAKFLGLMVDGSLTWKEHVRLVAGKLNKSYFLLHSLSNCLSRKHLLMVYYAYVYSYLRYGVIFWGNSTDSGKIFILQKRILRVIFGLSYRDSCKEIFKTNGLLTFPAIYIYFTLLHTRLNIGKSNRVNATHQYCTRNRDLLLFPIHRTSLLEQSPHYSGLRLYNKLPLLIKNQSNFKNYKKCLLLFLINKCFYSVDEYLMDAGNT
jgi:hypothetical protein